MTLESNSSTARRPYARALIVTALLCGLAGASGCGKVITIGDAAPATGSPAAPAPATPQAPAPSTPSAPAAGDTAPPSTGAAPQLIDGSAAENGLTGDGGTVRGAAVQERPPVWVELSAVASPALGAHLVDINRSTLYRFDKDTAHPSRSNCEGDCATTWPPVTVQEGGRVYVAGVDPSRVGAIRRGDGGVQLTVGGWPVYRYSGDEKPGDANGQGVGGTWFAVAPHGARAVPQ
ncbi:hypothetical protein AB0G15_12120 [Streptosporangium sp. NPDC023825]|uniref:hypothetical protein n=1 Tax=Streptosporangium sp. NPDC023825 TaxID=3154909 RepID=UPI0034347AC4